MDRDVGRKVLDRGELIKRLQASVQDRRTLAPRADEHGVQTQRWLGENARVVDDILPV